MWPWKRYRRVAEEAAKEAAAAQVDRQDAVARRETAERQARRAQAVTAALRYEIDRNGWTELLQKAWGR